MQWWRAKVVACAKSGKKVFGSKCDEKDAVGCLWHPCPKFRLLKHYGSLIPEKKDGIKPVQRDIQQLANEFRCCIIIRNSTFHTICKVQPDEQELLDKYARKVMSRVVQLVYRDAHYFLVDEDVRFQQVGEKRKAMRQKIKRCPKCGFKHTIGNNCRKKRRNKVSPLSELEREQKAEEKMKQTIGENIEYLDRHDSKLREMNRSYDSLDPSIVEEWEYRKLKAQVFSMHSSTKNCIIVSGAGGTGKTFILRRLHADAEKIYGSPCSEFVLTATTGVAAQSIGGYIINQFLHLGKPKSGKYQSLFNRLCNDNVVLDRVGNLRVLVIDEASMLSSELFEFLDQMFKIVRGNSTFFGGVKLVLSLDILQLPPVDGSYFFLSKIWAQSVEKSLYVSYLTKNWRFDKDKEWGEILGRIRRNLILADDLRELEKRICPKPDSVCWLGDTTVLLPRRRLSLSSNNMFTSVENYHKEVIVKFVVTSQGSEVYAAKDTIELTQDQKRKLVLPETLHVWNGARVMMLRNTYFQSDKVCNGSIGEVIGMSDTVITVKFENGATVEVKKEKEEIEGRSRWRDRVRECPSREQFPLTLAYAMSIHKCQSLTLEGRTLMDLGENVFEAGQGYVALSRCRTRKQVNLLALNPASLKVNEVALFFDRWLMGHTENTKHFPIPARLRSHVRTHVSIRDLMGATVRYTPYSPHHDLITKNTLFFDFETYPEESEKGFTMEEKPYFNHYIFYRHGKLHSQHTDCTICNPEMDVRKRLFDIVMSIVKSQNAQYKELFRKFKNKHRVPLTVAAYNGSKFDFHFFMQMVMADPQLSEEYETQIVLKQSAIVCMKLYHKETRSVAMKVHDLYQILGCSLAKAAKEFLGDDGLSKGVFPHLAVTKNLLDKLRADCNYKPKLQLRDFPIKMQGQALKMGESDPRFSLDGFHFHDILHEYGVQDVEVLRDVYLAGDACSQEILNTSILHFSTVSKMSWYGFLSHIPAELELAHNEREKRYDLYHMLLKEDKEIQGSIVGGKTYPRIMRFVSKDMFKPYDETKVCFSYLDIVSMYVTAMMKYSYPCGVYEKYSAQSPNVAHIRELVNKSDWKAIRDLPKIGFVNVRFAFHPCETEPVLATKAEDGRLIWDLGERKSWITTTDLALLVRNESTILHVGEAYLFEKRVPLFRKWACKTFNGKKEAARLKQEAKKLFFKLLGNASYGCVLQRDFNETTHMVGTIEDLEKFHQHYEWLDTVNWEQWNRATELKDGEGEHLLVLKGMKTREEILEFTGRPRYLGAFVLAASRLMLDEILNVVNPWRRSGNALSLQNMVLYGDTDSLVVKSEGLERLRNAGKLGNEPGQLGDELIGKKADFSCKDKMKFAKVVKYLGTAPKSYGMLAMLPPDMCTKVLLQISEEKLASVDVEIEGETLQRYRVNGRYHYVFTAETYLNCYIEVVKMKGLNLKDFEFELKGQTYTELTLDQMEYIYDHREEQIVGKMNNRILKCGTHLTRKEKQEGLRTFSIKRGDIERTFFKNGWEGRRCVFEGSRFTVPPSWRFNETLSEEEIEREKRSLL